MQCYGYCDGCDIWYNFFDTGRFASGIHQEKKRYNQKKKGKDVYLHFVFALTKFNSVILSSFL